MATILLATSSDWPDLFADDVPLLHALLERGIAACPAVWDDPSIEWARADAVVIRSVWDYTMKRDAFVAWAASVARTTALFNPDSVVRWNSHKGYLRDLERMGVPVVPTEWVDAGSERALDDIMTSRGWSEVVVKPAVSAGARNTIRVTSENLSDGQEHLNAIAQRTDVMVQPYLRDTEGIGEHALIHIAGEPTHVVRKEPALTGAPYSSSTVVVAEAHPAEPALAEQVLATASELLGLDGPLLYARVDSIVTDGVASLMELEIIEPQLFFRTVPAAAARMADALVALLD